MDKNYRALLQKYLMASYLYYERFQSVMPDSEYDQLAKDLLEGWDTFDHQHKYLVTKGDLKAGTLYAVRDYPTMIMCAADMWLRKSEESKIYAGD